MVAVVVIVLVVVVAIVFCIGWSIFVFLLRVILTGLVVARSLHGGGSPDLSH